jgi:hypothetical protein
MKVDPEAEKSVRANKPLLSSTRQKSRYFLDGNFLGYEPPASRSTQPRCGVEVPFTENLRQLPHPVISSRRTTSGAGPSNIEFNTPSPWDPPQEILYRYCTTCNFSHWDFELVRCHRDTERVEICAPTPVRRSKAGKWTKFQCCLTKNWEEKAIKTSKSIMIKWRSVAQEEIAHRNAVDHGVLD